MIVFMKRTIGLTGGERRELSQRAASRSGRADDGRRARLILLLEAGHSWAQIRDKLSCNDAFIARWSKRFGRERLAGLFSRHAGQGPRKLTPRLEARILDWTVKRKPADGSTHWSTRKLGSALSISHMMVARVWAKHPLKPQRLDRYMASNDPDFERKAADIIGLYMNPPAHARCSAWMRRRRSRRSTARPRCCRCHLAGRSGTALILSPWYIVSVRRVQHQNRRGAGQNHDAPHFGRVCRLSDRHRRQSAGGPG